MKRRIQKKILKNRIQLLATVVKILDDIDPMGLLFIASKADFTLEEEYLPEAKEIVARLDNRMKLKDIENDLIRIFDYYFYFPDIPREYYIAAARKIMNAWLVFQGRQAVDFPDDIELPQHPEPIIVEVD
jgi:hypothetical protein